MTVEILARCADCDQSVLVPWPEDEYSATLENQVALDGRVQLPDGWWAVPGAFGGDNLLRCPVHSKLRVSQGLNQ